MGQVNEKNFLEYLNVKCNPEKATRYLGFVRVGKCFIEWNTMKWGFSVGSQCGQGKGCAGWKEEPKLDNAKEK